MQTSRDGHDPSAGGLHAGLDVGSVSINSVVINAHRQILFESPYRRHFGKVDDTVAALIVALYEKFGRDQVVGIAFTGSHGKKISEQLGAHSRIRDHQPGAGGGPRAAGRADPGPVHGRPGHGPWCRSPTAPPAGSWSTSTQTVPVRRERAPSSTSRPKGWPPPSIPPKWMDQDADRHDPRRLHRARAEEPQARPCCMPLHGLHQVRHDPPAEQGREAGGHHLRPAHRECPELYEHDRLQPQPGGSHPFRGRVVFERAAGSSIPNYFPNLIVPGHSPSAGALGVAIHALESGVENRLDPSRLRNEEEKEILNLTARIAAADSKNPVPGREHGRPKAPRAGRSPCTWGSTSAPPPPSTPSCWQAERSSTRTMSIPRESPSK